MLKGDLPQHILSWPPAAYFKLTSRSIFWVGLPQRTNILRGLPTAFQRNFKALLIFFCINEKLDPEIRLGSLSELGAQGAAVCNSLFALSYGTGNGGRTNICVWVIAHQNLGNSYITQQLIPRCLLYVYYTNATNEAGKSRMTTRSVKDDWTAISGARIDCALL